MMDDFVPVTVAPEAAGCAAEAVFEAGGRDDFFPILSVFCWSDLEIVTPETTLPGLSRNKRNIARMSNILVQSSRRHGRRYQPVRRRYEKKKSF